MTGLECPLQLARRPDAEPGHGQRRKRGQDRAGCSQESRLADRGQDIVEAPDGGAACPQPAQQGRQRHQQRQGGESHRQ